MSTASHLLKIVEVPRSKDGRLLDHTAVVNGTVAIGRAGDEAHFILEEALEMMPLLPEEERYFRATPAGRGGNGRVKVVGTVKRTLSEVLDAAA